MGQKALAAPEDQEGLGAAASEGTKKCCREGRPEARVVREAPWEDRC